MANKERAGKNTRPQKDKTARNVDIVITGNVAWCDKLSWSEKILYGIIRGLTRNDYYCCYASNEHLGARLNRDESVVRRYLRSLEKLGFIQREDAYIADDYGGIYYTRAIVPTDMLKKFESKREEMYTLKGVQKNTTKAGNFARPQAGKNTRLSINMYPYKENNKSLTNNKDRDIPPNPQGGQSGEKSDSEQYLVYGKEQNVHLTKCQRTALSEEFGDGLASALIEQLSAVIKSGMKRFRKNTEHYSVLRYWGLRENSRTQQQIATPSDNFDEDITGGSFI